MWRILFLCLAMFLSGCVESLETAQKWYYMVQEKCPTGDCAYCNASKWNDLKAATEDGEGVYKYSVCRSDCSYCKKLRAIYTSEELSESDEANIARIDSNMYLNTEIEAFLKESMPEVYRQRNVIIREYKRMRTSISNLNETAKLISSEDAINVCVEKRNEQTKKSIKIARKLTEINGEIEKAYAKFKVSSYENSKDNLEEISKVSDNLLEDIKSLQTEIR